MSESLDPVVVRLFEEGEETLSGTNFVQQLDGRIAWQRQRIVLTRFALVAAALSLEILLDSPVRHSVAEFASALTTTLYSTDNQWLDYLLAPVNSIAGMLGALLLGAHVLHRRIRS